MEVHAHSHTERKKWTHYLWEFLMLFLAVFCGFLAENIREHGVDHRLERQYISSLVQDIRTDTANITQWASLYGYLQSQCDSVILNFSEFSKYGSTRAAENFSSITYGFPDFYYTDQTMQQLKNAGGLRLIRNAVAADSIIAYDAAAADIEKEETAIVQYYVQLRDLSDKILSYRKIKEASGFFQSADTIKQKINFWLVNDAVTMDQLYNLVFKYKQTIFLYVNEMKAFRTGGGRLISLLKKEYHLK